MNKYNIYTTNELLEIVIERIFSLFEQNKPAIKKLVETTEDFKKIERIKVFVHNLEKEYINKLVLLINEIKEIVKDIKEGFDSFLDKIIVLCVSSLSKIFEDNIVSLKDVPIFIEMIMNIFNNINNINIKLDLNKVVILCEFICKVLIISMNKTDTEIFIQILENSVKLAKFELNKNKEDIDICFCF